MNFCAIDIAGTTLHALPCGALWWPGERTLVVADLHLGKSERMARRAGALLPPYEVEETLLRLSAVIEATAPERVVCLGDSFDDDAARAALPADAVARLAALGRERDWVWVSGNHDPDVAGDDPGRDAVEIGSLCFRHIATIGGRGEISGHYHPKARVALGGRSISRRCFLEDGNRIILPAYGTYTGGLDARDPVFAPLFSGDMRAVLVGPRPCRIPLRRGTVRRAS